jgi:hypothetical protein
MRTIPAAQGRGGARGTWCSLQAVEFATLDLVDWFTMGRLLGPIGDVPPTAFEAQYHEQAAVA